VWDKYYTWETCEMYTKFLLENLKRPLQRHRHRWEDNIKMDLKERGCKDVEMDLTDSRQGPTVGSFNTVMNFQIS
jgi:hypothetical protein